MTSREVTRFYLVTLKSTLYDFNCNEELSLSREVTRFYLVTSREVQPCNEVNSL